MSIRLRNCKGEGITSQMIGIVIGTIVLMYGASKGYQQLQRSRVVSVESDFRVIAADLETAIAEIGIFDEKADSDNFDTLADKYSTYLKTLNSDYLHTQVGVTECKKESEVTDELRTCVITSNGFYVRTATKDSWGTEYRLVYTESEDVGRTFAIFSAGPNGRFDTENIDTVNDKKYDDISCIISIKNTSLDKEITFDRFL